MNELLNYAIPYFRCPERDIWRAYYFLWSVHLMLYTRGSRGGPCSSNAAYGG